MVSDAAPPRRRGAGSCSRIWTTPRVARSCSQHTIGLAGKVISDTARANADPPVTQVLEISDPGIRTSDNGKCLGVHGLPVAAQSDSTSGRDDQRGTGFQPAALYQLHRSSNGGRPAGAGRRGVMPAARWELADYTEYAGLPPQVYVVPAPTQYPPEAITCARPRRAETARSTVPTVHSTLIPIIITPILLFIRTGPLNPGSSGSGPLSSAVILANTTRTTAAASSLC